MLLFRRRRCGHAGRAGGNAGHRDNPDVRRVGGVSNFQDIPQSCGDNVVASPDSNGHGYGLGAEGQTPNVAASYGSAGEDPALWTTGHGNLTNIYVNDAAGDTTLTLTLAAATGFLVDLYGFDLASFIAGGQTIAGLSVIHVASSQVLFSKGRTATSGTTRNSFDFGANPLSASALQLTVDLTGLGGLSDDIGMDNVRFGQRLASVPPVDPGAVPEPATWAMMIGGFGLVGGAMRRRRMLVTA